MDMHRLTTNVCVVVPRRTPFKARGPRLRSYKVTPLNIQMLLDRALAPLADGPRRR